MKTQINSHTINQQDPDAADLVDMVGESVHFGDGYDQEETIVQQEEIAQPSAKQVAISIQETKDDSSTHSVSTALIQRGGMHSINAEMMSIPTPTSRSCWDILLARISQSCSTLFGYKQQNTSRYQLIKGEKDYSLTL